MGGGYVPETLKAMLEFFKDFGLVVGIGTAVMLLGLSIILYGVRQLKEAASTSLPQNNTTSSADAVRFQQLATDTFGDISLMERNEEGRRKVSNVQSLAQFLGFAKKEGSDYTIVRFYDDLFDLMTLRKDDGQRISDKRDQLAQLLQNGTKFEQNYLKDYVKALLGMTFVIEGQDPQNCQKALTWINDAEQDLEEHFPEARAESIVNVRGICRIVQARNADNGSRTILDRVRLSLDAQKDFSAALKLRATRHSPGTINQYRYLTNHVEWCADVYYLWSQLGEADRPVADEIITARMRDFDIDAQKIFGFPLFSVSSSSQSAGPLLLNSACAACIEGIKRSSGSEIDGRSRPAIHISALILAVALDHASRAHPPIPIPDSIKSEVGRNAISKHVEPAIQQLLEENSPESVRRLLSDSPVLTSWISESSFKEQYEAAIKRFTVEGSR